MLRWRIYYDDGPAFSNEDGMFGDAPCDGVLAIVIRDKEVGYQVYYNKDYYFATPDDETIGMTDDIGPFLRQLGCIKFGRWTGQTTWAKTWDKILEESRRDFGLKSGKKFTEKGKL